MHLLTFITDDQVSDVSTSKTGKHGSAKCNFTAIDIFTGRKYEAIVPSSANWEVPFIFRSEYTLVDIKDDGFVSRLTSSPPLT
jgi:translation initiation factor 5A